MNKPKHKQAILQVVQAGPSACLQDLGRRHSTHHGVTEGGVADIHAAMWANHLLGRNMAEPLIEITIGLFTVEFLAECEIALTGADLGATLNDQPFTAWQSQHINVGDRLQFATPKNGLRSYLAINAQLDLTPVFTSFSTVIREKMGGLDGGNLQVGDQLFGRLAIPQNYDRKVPRQYIPDYSALLNLQLIPSCQFIQFPQHAVDCLETGSYQIQSNSNRMAYSLKGRKINHQISALSSEGIAYGAVQIPPDGQPIVLLNDRQTMGGYPKIGCISKLSGAALAQRFHPTEVSFSLCSVETAAEEYKAHLAFFKEVV